VDVLVIGAGLAGLAAAWQSAKGGKKTRLVTKGWGALYWHAGCIDILGYNPLDRSLVETPAEALKTFSASLPDHPYSRVMRRGGLDLFESALKELQELCAASRYPLHGSLERNWRLPSAVGAPRPTCLAPETMIAGDLRDRSQTLIAGFAQFSDFYPAWIAANLSAQEIPASGVTLNLPILADRAFVTARTLAMLFDEEEFRSQVAAAIRNHLMRHPGMHPARVGFPAVLGLENPIAVLRDLEARLELPVFEIPTLPPSIPGIRLSRILCRAIEAGAGRVFEGMQAVNITAEAGRLDTVWTEAAARRKPHRASTFILASGGILGGGIRAEFDGSVQEPIAGLPVNAPARRDQWLGKEFLAPDGHPIFRAGLNVDDTFRVCGPDGKPVYDNLYAAGSALAHNDFLAERSLEGIALITGFLISKF
jgi:glycerol-3-phosphate dehydrogenase subunit B